MPWYIIQSGAQSNEVVKSKPSVSLDGVRRIQDCSLLTGMSKIIRTVQSILIRENILHSASTNIDSTWDHRLKAPADQDSSSGLISQPDR